ncbi:uncharacterized protein LOC134693726 [Mytilus trossulus]|uniref:uncharacterized protein LOC134693726 n=1 Tax=Mytilus trossulus TaxID=6551 RepID=UPI0030050AC1
MSCSSKWYFLTKLNKVIFTVTLVALCLLVLGFLTPFWILISVEFFFHEYSRNIEVYSFYELPETEYLGLWQWCFKHYGCFDLSLLAKYFSTLYKSDGREDTPIYKINSVINLWIVSRSCATVAVVCAISFSIWKLYFIWRRKSNHVRVYHSVSIVVNFFISSALTVCLVTFGVATQTLDELKNYYISEISIIQDINRYFFISFWMVSVSTLLYFCKWNTSCN